MPSVLQNLVMSLKTNSKALLGIAMALLVLSVPLSIISTGAVEDAVIENFETYPTDNACANDDCTEANEDWATSTASRSYYAWNLTNPGEDPPIYEKVGPFDYDITYTREIIEFDKEAGTLKYSESKVYTCAEDARTPCDTEVTTTNIPFQPQVVGATGPAISGIMDLTKAGFAAGAINNEMTSFSAGKVTAEWVSNTMAGGYVAYTDGETTDPANASIAIGMNWYNQFDAYFAATNMSGYNNVSGYPATVNYTQAIQGQQQAAGETNLSKMFTGSSSITDLTYAFDSAVMPTGEDVSLSGMVGVMVLAGHCNAFPTATYGEVMADAGNGFANVGTMQRASIWGFLVDPTAPMPDINATIANDIAVCWGIAGMFANVFGGGDDDWFMDQSGTAVNASTRMMNYLGVDIDNAIAMNLLFGGQGEEVPTGLLATNAVGDESATAFGVATFIGMDTATAISTYNLDVEQYGAIFAWVGGWLTSQSSLPMVLLGGSGTITAEQFVNITLGGEDPINGGYLTYSLNLGGAWGVMGDSLGAPPVYVDPATAGVLLYGPMGITTTTGAGFFLFGELHGVTPPLNMSNTPPTPEEGGVQMPWNEATVSSLYGIDANAAAALRTLVKNAVYGDFVPDLLIDMGSDGPYKTQTVNEWLFGWFDPISYAVSSNQSNPSAGWSKLETNQSYYGSISEAHPNGISTGPATTYTICTGHNPNCDKGETIFEDGSDQLDWHNSTMANATFGIVGIEYLSETTGGFLTGSGDKVDAGGYAIIENVEHVGKDEVKCIPVDVYSATVDHTSRNITAKLIKSYTLLDAMTPALPIYFGTEINMYAEEISGLIIKGDSTSTFYLDVRPEAERSTAPASGDLKPLFQIIQSSEIEDDDAEEMKSKIVTNQNYLTYWTNFDVPTDYLAPLLLIGALLFMMLGLNARSSTKSYEMSPEEE